MMTYNFADMMDELDNRFEDNVRKTFDHYKGLPGPIFMLIARVNPTTGKPFDKPTPCPVMFQNQGGPVTTRDIVDGVKRQIILTDAVASFCAYPMEHGIKIHVELPCETHEWLVPVLRLAGATEHYYMGKRVVFASGRGEHARTLDELDEFGGLFNKSTVTKLES